MTPDEIRFFEEASVLLETKYLAGTNPREQSGFGRDQLDWERYRRVVERQRVTDEDDLAVAEETGPRTDYNVELPFLHHPGAALRLGGVLARDQRQKTCGNDGGLAGHVLPFLAHPTVAQAWLSRHTPFYVVIPAI
jgi:hypothetical protein